MINRLKSVSRKRQILNKEYSILRKEFLSKPENKICYARLPGCTGNDPSKLTIHHKRGREGSYFLDITHWIAVCLHCHDWIERNPWQAKELGLSESRLINNSLN